MAKFNIKISGLEAIKKKLGKEGQKRVRQEISDELMIAANDVRNKAVQRVPVNQGFLRNSIEVQGKDLVWIVQATADYAEYQEFGTKTMVNVPAEMKDAAMAVNSGKKSYQSFKDAIAEWMRLKGIPEQALYPIMAKIMEVGIRPRPFMYPSFKEGTQNLQKDIDRIIQKYLDK